MAASVGAHKDDEVVLKGAHFYDSGAEAEEDEELREGESGQGMQPPGGSQSCAAARKLYSALFLLHSTLHCSAAPEPVPVRCGLVSN